MSGQETSFVTWVMIGSYQCHHTISQHESVFCIQHVMNQPTNKLNDTDWFGYNWSDTLLLAGVLYSKLFLTKDNHSFVLRIALVIQVWQNYVLFVDIWEGKYVKIRIQTHANQCWSPPHWIQITVEDLFGRRGGMRLCATIFITPVSQPGTELHQMHHRLLYNLDKFSVWLTLYWPSKTPTAEVCHKYQIAIQ